MHQCVHPRKRHLFAASGCLPLLLLAQSGFAQVNVLTQHNDNARTGQNLNETILTPRNVTNSTFGALFSVSVDGQVYAQPLYMSGLTIGGAAHNVVFVATEHDSVYAFDADASGAPLWKASLIDTAHGAASGATPESSSCGEVTPELGITGTPVIDANSKTLYVAAKSTEGGKAVYRLHAIDITTGAERQNSPIVIQGTVPNKTGSLSFDPAWHRQRPGLLLLNNIVYVGFAAICDSGPWHGWMMAYNATTLAQTSVYTPTPDGTGSGIWMSGAGLAADVIDPANHPFGRMFIATGNGTYDGVTDYGDDHERFDLTNGVITYSDSFTPSIQSSLNSGDLDVAAGGVLLLPDQAGPHQRLLVQAGKTGTLYVVDRDNMGGYHTTDGIVQEISGLGGMWGMPAYWNSNVYYWGKQDKLKQFAVSNGMLTGPVATGLETHGNGSTSYYGGTTPSISANGNTNGIVWNIDSLAKVLYAHDASNVATTLFSTALGASIKFAVPTVANGKVYIGSYSLLTVYGLLPGGQDFSISAAPPSITMGPGSTATSTISVASTGGFNGPVTLSLGSLPAGVTASLSSSTVTGSGSVTLTVNTASSVSGSFGVTVTGTASTGTHSAMVNVNIPSTRAPVFTPAGGTYTSTQNVTITDSTSGAAIYYTTDGSTPTRSSTSYSSPISISATATLKAIAIAPGASPSSVTSAVYTIGQSSRAPSGQWSMESITGGLTPDSSGNGNSASVTAATLAPGRVGNAIQFDPNTGGGLTQRLPFTSTQSFTVATWVKLSDAHSYQSFVSQPASQVSNFYLELGVDVGSNLVFDFDLFPSDSTTASDVIATGTTIAVPNTWYHLVGVYDSVNRTASLFVNGKLESQIPANGAFANTGGLAMGYSLWQSARAGGTNALIDEVLAYPVALSASEVSALYSSYSPAVVSVSLTSPANGATFAAPATINLAASASTTSGTITRVEFYNGATLLYQANSTPYSFSWTNVGAGTYSLTAKAYPSTGSPVTSAPVSVTVQSASQGSPPPSGQWNLDGASGNVTPDASGSGNNATLSGGYSFVTGKIGNAIKFVPSTGAAQTQTAPFDPRQSFSIAAWVNLAQVSGFQGFVCQPAATGSTFYLELGINTGGKLVFDFDVFPVDSPTAADAIAVGTTAAVAGNWYHIVGVYDGTSRNVQLYVNGQLEGQVPGGPSFANSGGLAFGYSKWQGGRVEATDARIDDVRAYRTALTAAQVQALYQGR